MGKENKICPKIKIKKKKENKKFKKKKKKKKNNDGRKFSYISACAAHVLLGKTKRQEFMEHLTVEANQRLCQFLQVWSPDALEGQRITISNTHVTIEVPDEQQTIPIGDILQNVLDPMIEKCKEDLQREGIEIIPFPEYLEKYEEAKLHFLLDFTTQPAFQCRKTNI